MIPLDVYSDDDKPREECGVFAVHLPEPADVAALCHLGVFALQHRGQESCGICVSNGEDIVAETSEKFNNGLRELLISV